MSWWLVSFERRGPARFISHLDTARVVQRTFARAGIELALSQGMRPKPRLSLPLPLPTGAAGLEELAVVGVVETTPPDELSARLRSLRAACPEGVAIRGLVQTEERPRPHAAAAAYECRLPAPCAAVEDALRWFDSAPRVTIERRSPKGHRAVEVKEYVSGLSASPVGDGTTLAFTLRYRADGSARVDEVVAALAGRLEIEPVVLDLVRTRVDWKGLPSGGSPGAATGLPDRAEAGPEQGLPCGQQPGTGQLSPGGTAAGKGDDTQ
ncbi:MAG TPA: TIGR03936 family radical SAM-associated protein [Thermoleophilia bacterium]|nr:TIGR03936 family radical SAM-associated protein [Thermoleophilia bacterium]